MELVLQRYPEMLDPASYTVIWLRAQGKAAYAAGVDDEPWYRQTRNSHGAEGTRSTNLTTLEADAADVET